MVAQSQVGTCLPAVGTAGHTRWEVSGTSAEMLYVIPGQETALFCHAVPLALTAWMNAASSFLCLEYGLECGSWGD